jgi:hypothetical protein
MIKRAVILGAIIAGLLVYAAMQGVEQPEPMASPLIKITQQGQTISVWAGPWACVFDKQTGLLWEVKTDNETIHDGYWSYSWFDGLRGKANSGDCYFEKDGCDTQDLIHRANRENTCGVAGWRLPAPSELLSLVETNPRPGEPTIAKDFFPQTRRGDYWTGDAEQALDGAFQHLGEGAIAVDFVTGSVTKLPYRNAAFVRLVSDQFLNQSR